MKTQKAVNVLFYNLTLMVLFSLLIIGCKKKEEAKPEVETNYITDKEGNSYKTVKIGNQWWMAENLKVKKYLNGDAINLAQATVNWKDTNAAYCVYTPTPTTTEILYNWYAVKDARGIAPVGWHIPTDAEWKELEQYLGMNATDADKVNFRGAHEGEKLMKSACWPEYGEVWGTNESGFTATPGGCRLPSGGWGETINDKAGIGFWWSSSLNASNNSPWYRYLDYKKANVFRFYGSKNYGCSIRCVKDSEFKPR